MAVRVDIVEDDAGIRELLCLNLGMAGFDVRIAQPGLLAAGLSVPDALVLAWNHDPRPTLDLLRLLRGVQRWDPVPVLVLSGAPTESEQLRAFACGADDVMSKPFSPRELIARVQALLRRARREQETTALEMDGLAIDASTGQARIGGVPLALRGRELRLLQVLLQSPSQVYSRSRLLELVWADMPDAGYRTVDACVARLRESLEKAGHHPCIETVRAIGYRLIPRQGAQAHG